ncbi:clustered mitochondria-domain-containing protein [Entophlyctis helioformis]|nr:clustered mitochondria-domain-containing protein [Entophlyctis helioformis]
MTASTAPSKGKKKSAKKAAASKAAEAPAATAAAAAAAPDASAAPALAAADDAAPLAAAPAAAATNGSVAAESAVADPAPETAAEAVEPEHVPITIELPGDNGQMSVLVTPLTTVQEIRAAIIDSPKSQFDSCFYIAFEGQRLLDTTDVGAIPNFAAGATMHVVEDVYNDHEVRIHLSRVRDILVEFQPSTNAYAVDLAASFLSTVDPAAISNREALEKVERPKASAEGADEDIKPPSQAALDAVKLFDTCIFDGAVKTGLANFVPAGFHTTPVKCVASMALSAWSPPPLKRRMAGDLLYLTVETLEGETLEITAAVSGFYINGSTAKVFNPAPRKANPHHAHTLPRLLSEASALFASSFAELQTRVAVRHPLEYVGSSVPAYPWIVKSQPHTSDSGRTLDSNLQASDAMEALTARDWNEDIQTARELPRETLQDRLGRDQAVSKAHGDFIDAAVRGVTSIVNKAIPPVNGLEADPMSQMYIHNNIFFSEGSDNRDLFEMYGGLGAAHVAVSKDIDGIRILNQIDPENLHTLGTAVVDYMGRRIVAQTIVPGILRKVASQESAVQYGSVDNGKEIFVHEQLKATIGKLARTLHLKSHKLTNANDETVELLTSVDTKGVIGSDSREYLLDLYRLTPVDINFQEVKVEEYNKKKEEAGAGDFAEPAPVFTFDVSFNMDAFTLAKSGEDAESAAKQEALIREACSFVGLSVRQFVADVATYPSTAPMDSVTLTKQLHRRGINMRYLGQLYKLLNSLGEMSLSFVKSLCFQEMVLRAAKTVLRGLLNELPVYLAGACISHFLNCFYADDKKTVTLKLDATHAAVTDASKYAFTSLTPATLHASIRTEVERRFRFKIDAGQAFWTERQIPFLRALALKVGFQVEAKEYFAQAPKAVVFEAGDIVNVYPIIKQAQPRAAYAEEAFEHGRNILQQEQQKAAAAAAAADAEETDAADAKEMPKKELGMDLYRESLAMYEQVFGPVHPDSGRLCASLAMAHFNDDEHDRALYYQQRAVIISERVHGVDSSETIQQYMNLAYFEYAAGHLVLGLKYMHHALHYWQLLCAGGEHPDTAAIFANVATMLQNMGLNVQAVTFFEQAAKLNDSIHGANSGLTANAYEVLTQAYVMQGDFRKALASHKHVYNYCTTRYGGAHERTQEAGTLLRKLTESAVMTAKREKAAAVAAGVAPAASVTAAAAADAPAAAPAAAAAGPKTGGAKSASKNKKKK